MRPSIAFGFIVLLVTAGLTGAWLARASAQQPPEYQTQASCHFATVASFAGVPETVNNVISAAARNGWVFVSMTAVSPGSGVCVLLTFRKG